MLLIIITLALVLGIAFFQSVQGLFSAIIMAILTIFCTLLAFNFYEPLAASFLYDRQPEYADATALISIFVLSLLALRLLFDKFLGGNVVTEVWVDRIAGGVVGLVSALLIVGVLMIAIQMLPWGSSILGYVPYKDTLERNSSLFPYPDEFTVGLVSTLSGGTPGGSPSGSMAPEPAKPYSYTHDDLLLEIWGSRNTGRGVPTEQEPAGPALCGSTAVNPGALTVLGSFAPPAGDTSFNEPPNYAPLKDRSTSQYKASRTVIVRIRLDDKSGAIDIDKMWRLVATQFRLVSKNGKSYYPIGYLTYSGSKPTADKRVGWELVSPKDGEGNALIGKIAVVRSTEKHQTITIDWVYRLPYEEVPEYMTFRRIARTSVPPPKADMPDYNQALDRK